jgi:hypothetical protein
MVKITTILLVVTFHHIVSNVSSGDEQAVYFVLEWTREPP